MADALFVLIMIAFFGLAGGLVAVCDRIIGPGEEAARPVTEPVEELAA